MDATQRIQQIFCEADFNKQLKLFLDKGWKLVDICMDSIALAEGKSFSGETHELESLNTRFLHWLNKYTVHVYETCHCPPSNLTPTLTRIKYLIGTTNPRTVMFLSFPDEGKRSLRRHAVDL